ncbi:uncharacterized protein LOC129549195 [Moschus berezovskii]|uniref:uncharacterized protein LOC129549195 n=1 Tax=Moschus berezovskii TaxID=68408 RepID=UPI002444105D|nr:uncharacterized protein LOC129549195 [Moschus berezovskii]
MRLHHLLLALLFVVLSAASEKQNDVLVVMNELGVLLPVGLGEAPSHVRPGGFGAWAAVGRRERRLRPEVCRAEHPGTLPAASDGLRGASSSGRPLRGEQDNTEVRRSEPRVDAEPGPAAARVASRSPLAPSEAASDAPGMSCGIMTLDRGFGPRAPVPAPPPTAGHVPSRRLRALVREMPELGPVPGGALTARRVPITGR